jgi:YrbI family 3-deoxy-D-manno-octulosonate 8-phosphate phosphatase
MRIAIIPARGASKRLLRKNLALVAGVPLVAHTIRHARGASRVDAVIVSTEDPEIADVARSEGADVVIRPEALASDAATSESALLHVLDTRRDRGLPDPDLVAFLQCTSPVREPDDIDRAIDQLEADGADSLLSVCENTRFVWASGANGPASINYDFRHRRREQDLDPQFQENGSIYVFRPWVLRQQNNRLGGRIALYEMDYWSSFQIDSPEDLALCNWILRQRRPQDTWAASLRLIVFDFDGVMTDNRVLVHQDGTETVVCDRGDGLGIERLRTRGMKMLVLSKEANPVVAARCRKLQLDCVQGIDDKAGYLRRHLLEESIDPVDVAYVGNDVNDLECLKLVGMPIVVQDAHPSVRNVARLILDAPGGRGAVRELCDRVLAISQPEGERTDGTDY